MWIPAAALAVPGLPWVSCFRLLALSLKNKCLDGVGFGLVVFVFYCLEIRMVKCDAGLHHYDKFRVLRPNSLVHQILAVKQG